MSKSSETEKNSKRNPFFFIQTKVYCGHGFTCQRSLSYLQTTSVESKNRTYFVNIR